MTKKEQTTKAGIASGLARQTPELLAAKQTAIKLHVENVYRTGHRERNRNYGHISKRRVLPNTPRRIPITEKRVIAAQSAAWRREWIWAWKFDDNNHWRLHPINRPNPPHKEQYQKRKNDPHFRFALAMRHRIWKVLKNANARKSSDSFDLVGCTKEQLFRHIEALFKPGMSWENYGPVWHLDHIRPCASFDLTDPQQQRDCFHYSNLQPLPTLENFSKHARWKGVEWKVKRAPATICV